MRKFLLASVATLGTGGLTGAALAQAPAGPVGAPTQGQVAYPAAPSPTAYVNTNNNYQAPALPGALANPTPGTVVIHINGKVQVGLGAVWTSGDTRTFTAPAGSPGGAPITSIGSGPLAAGTATSASAALSAILGNNGAGTAKLQPQSTYAFAREYFGVDAMATNGLRYGAGIELRNNALGQASSTTTDNASGYSSLQTVYVRRMFVYAAGDNWGIVRAGSDDGLIGTFDNGVTTTVFSPTGNLGGGDLQSITPASAVPLFVAASTQGAEYYNTKLVYLSPQIAGFDFGLQYAPTTSNGLGNNSSAGGLQSSLTGSGNGTGLACGAATSGCPTLSSGPGAVDGARFIDQYAVGVRYQGSFSGLGVLAYGVYMGSGHVNYSGLPVTTAAGAANLGVTPALAAAGSQYTGKYNGLSLGSGGLALTFAGVTVAGNIIGGKENGQLALQPQGGAGLLGYVVGAKYINGPFTFGVQAEEYWEQGTVQLTGISQRRARGISVGPVYSVAPGFQVFAEYQWFDQQQTLNNVVTGAIGSTANNNIHAQGVLVGSVVNF